MTLRHAPTDSELARLHDRLWNDPRRRDDRSEFHECEECGRAIRWIVNLGSPTGGNIQVVARPVTTAAHLDLAQHAGLVAVWPDRTGFTLSTHTDPAEVDGAFLYECHWDVCEHARAVRDRMSRARSRPRLDVDPELDPELVRRYVAWRDDRSR